ncbi:glycosyltransferase family 4 protein [Gordonia terrae]
MTRTRNQARPRVAIIHPWLPHYRKEFFARLRGLAHREQIEIDIYYGSTPPEWSARNDALSTSDYTELPTRHYVIGGRSFSLKNTSDYRKNGPYDLTILEQAVRNLETYRILLSVANWRRVAFWGHGRNYTVQRSRPEEAFKKFLTKRGIWFFGYTEGGVKAVVADGFPDVATTVVYNSIDTRQLAAEISSVSEKTLSRIKTELGISPHAKVGLYLGGIDRVKRVDFLIESVKMIVNRVPDFTLIVAGDGDQRVEFESAVQECSQIVFVGPVFGSDKAALLRMADLLLIPGRVGLVAVDSAASGVPIITTDWPFHAPEFEYLTSGLDCVVSQNNETAYASAVVDTVIDSSVLGAMSRNCLELAENLSTERMASQFMDGILGALQLAD